MIIDTRQLSPPRHFDSDPGPRFWWKKGHVDVSWPLQTPPTAGHSWGGERVQTTVRSTKTIDRTFIAWAIKWAMNYWHAAPCNYFGWSLASSNLCKTGLNLVVPKRGSLNRHNFSGLWREQVAGQNCFKQCFWVAFSKGEKEIAGAGGGSI